MASPVADGKFSDLNDDIKGGQNIECESLVREWGGGIKGLKS
jgi:hypothetical protein